VRTIGKREYQREFAFYITLSMSIDYKNCKGKIEKIKKKIRNVRINRENKH
jgi:hypothetical protein